MTSTISMVGSHKKFTNKLHITPQKKPYLLKTKHMIVCIKKKSYFCRRLIVLNIKKT